MRADVEDPLQMNIKSWQAGYYVIGCPPGGDSGVIHVVDKCWCVDTDERKTLDGSLAALQKKLKSLKEGSNTELCVEQTSWSLGLERYWYWVTGYWAIVQSLQILDNVAVGIYFLL